MKIRTILCHLSCFIRNRWDVACRYPWMERLLFAAGMVSGLLHYDGLAVVFGLALVSVMVSGTLYSCLDPIAKELRDTKEWFVGGGPLQEPSNNDSGSSTKPNSIKPGGTSVY